MAVPSTVEKPAFLRLAGALGPMSTQPRLPAAAKQLQQKDEHVYEVEIEAQGAHDGALGDGRRIAAKLVVAGLDPLRVIGRETCEHEHTDHSDRELHRVRLKEQIDDRSKQETDTAHDQERTPPAEIPPRRIAVKS